MTRTVHLSGEDLQRYIARAMSGAELLDADDHLATCDDRYSRISEISAIKHRLSLASAAFEPPEVETLHVTYEQLESYVDSTLGEVDREIIDSHLELCGQCARELQDLRQAASIGG